MINPTDGGRLDALEQKLNELMLRIADLERRIAAVERTPQASKQVAPQPAAQQAKSSTATERNYLRRVIASAKKDYDKKYK